MSPYLKATSSILAPGGKHIIANSAVLAAEPVYNSDVGPRASVDQLRSAGPRMGTPVVSVGMLSKTSVRYAHTDLRVPDFSDYRRSDVADPKAKAKESVASRNAFTYLIAGGTFLKAIIIFTLQCAI